MGALKVLFIGGTGVISSACAQRLVERGADLTVLNRGATSTRPTPTGIRTLQADVRDPRTVQAALGDNKYDVVVDFVAFSPSQVQSDIDLFRGKTRQYVFISSASAYQTPPARLPILESTPLSNPFWQYSRDKIACEDLLVRAYREEGFPATIVRPSHTYDQTSIPFDGGWTVIDRMRRQVEVVVPGDGTSLWTLTHHTDFAKAFVGLLGNPHAIGDSFHITTDEVLTWNQIYQIIAAAAGVEPRLVHIASETVAAIAPQWGPHILGDLSHSMVFDNSKIKAIVPDYVATTPFATGAREILAWYDGDPSRRTTDPADDATFDRLIKFARPPL